MKAKVVVDLEDRLGTIDPKIYGHFIEHLGRCIYGGIWVGEDSKVPNERGFRKDVLEAVRAIKPPIVRWPGGSFASGYHFQDGIGARQNRPRRVELAWEVEESNQFGTDEYIQWCRKVGSEPYICVNAGSGTPEEAARWVEYCNRAPTTYHAQLRAKYGHPDPYRVRYWGIGNELYGEGQVGHCVDGKECAQRTIEFAKLMKRVDRNIDLVAVGCEDENWNWEMVRGAGKWFQHLSVHYYVGPRSFPDLMATPVHYERVVQRVFGTIEGARAAAKVGHPIKIALDEWNVWYPQANSPNYEQETSLSDGLFTALTFNGFHRLCNVLSMCCLAQLVNVLPLIRTRDDGAVYVNPQYLAFMLYVHRTGDTALRCRFDCDGYCSEMFKFDVPYLDASATLSEERRALYLHLVNRSADQTILCDVEIRAGEPKTGKVTFLTGAAPEAKNTFDQPNVVGLTEQTLGKVGARFTHEIPAHTAAVIELKLV